MIENIKERRVGRLVCGDCKGILAGLDNNSVDLIVTDPPYGISFMGKDWDRAVPSVDVWRECLRVLKPGAFAFVMSIPRMDCLGEMGRRLAEAGFETGFTPIFWAYASGFPKAQNIGKAVDKRLGAERDKVAATGGLTNYGNLNDDGWYKIGQDEAVMDSAIPATPEAQALDGSYAGFQPKPAVEVVIVAMKPLAHGTYVDQALDNGKGVTWLDEGRIPYQNDDAPGGGDKASSGFVSGYEHDGWQVTNHAGRFPANLLVEDDCLDDGRVQKSGVAIRHRAGGKTFASETDKPPMADMGYPDSGSFSRYFSLDAWSQAELSQLPESVQRTFPFLIVPKAGKREKEMGLEGMPEIVASGLPLRDGSGDYVENVGGDGTMSTRHTKRRNTHPTCKPLKLMCYLITLGSRPGDLVLDPFAGTCTTGMAAKMLGRDWLMIEIGEEWCEIGRRRIEAVAEKLL